MKLFRCSSLSKFMGDAKSIAPELRTPDIEALIKKRKRTDDEQIIISELLAQSLSSTAKSEIRKTVKEDLTGARKFKGNQYTEKGLFLEETAIDLSGKMRFRKYQKHVGRVENSLITGECDILDLDRKLILDTKCTWDIDTHPWFQDEALEKCIDAGYDWQMQGYMWLYNCNAAEVDFWLLPCPAELLKDWDDIDYLVHSIEAIDIRERKTTVRFERDESMIEKIKAKIPACQAYYDKLFSERKTVSRMALTA